MERRIVNQKTREFEVDLHPSLIHELTRAARSQNAERLYGIGPDHGMMALFSRPHSYNSETGLPSTYTMHPLGPMVFGGGSSGGVSRRQLPAGATHGFPGWERVELDPRKLVGSQPNVTIQGMEHYLGPHAGVYDTSMGESNALPTVIGFQGRNLILSGHHRATAALLKGVPLVARYKQHS